MKRNRILLIIGSLVICLSTTGYAGTKALMEKLCTKCHGLENPFSLKKNRADWEAIVALMASRSKDINTEDQSKIVDFLSEVRNIDTPILTAKDENNLTEIERIHIPVINAPISVKANSKAKIQVQVSEVGHPMTPDHYIYAVDLYVDGLWMDMVELQPKQSANVEFEVSVHKTSTIEVIVHSTVDGHWAAKTIIETAPE